MADFTGKEQNDFQGPKNVNALWVGSTVWHLAIFLSAFFPMHRKKKDEKRIIPIVMEIPSMLWSLIVKRGLITSFYSENKEEILSGYAIVSEYCCNI